MSGRWPRTLLGVVLVAAGLVVFADGLRDVLPLDYCDEGISRSGKQRGPDCEEGTGWAIVRLVLSSFVIVGGFVLGGQRMAGIGFGVWALVAATVLWDHGDGPARVFAVLTLVITAIVLLALVASARGRRRILRDGTAMTGRLQSVHLMDQGRNFSGARRYACDVAIQGPGQPPWLIRVEHEWRDSEVPSPGKVLAIRVLEGRAIVDHRA